MDGPGPNIRLLVVDDQLVVRAGVRALLQHEPQVEIVGEAEDESTTLELVETVAPDVVTLELSTYGLVATKLTQHIRRLKPTTRVLVFTTEETPLFVHAMLDAGASGYLSKRGSAHLSAAIAAVHRGERYICSFAAAALHHHLVRITTAEDAPEPSARAALARLSPREAAVLALLARGFTYQEIAAQLKVGVNTIGTYRSRLAEKLGVRGRQNLVRFALANGLVRPTTDQG